MVSWPPLGTRVTVRYRRPAGSVPPLTDAIGRLLAVDPLVRVQTKAGAIVECAPTEVVALRALTDAPMRTSEIRALEHAAATAWPGIERVWLDGWLLRAGRSPSLVDSAVPLDVSASAAAVPAIFDWYEQRGMTPRLAIPDRLLRPPAGLPEEHSERVVVRDIADLPVTATDPSTAIFLRPEENIDAEVAVGTHSGTAAVAQAAVSTAPGGTRWVGLSALQATEDPAASGPLDRLCEALLAWG
jgi:hypothetical protein